MMCCYYLNIQTINIAYSRVNTVFIQKKRYTENVESTTEKAAINDEVALVFGGSGSI